METKQPSATITDAQRLKLLKWAKKNGATRISIDGVSLEFNRSVEVRPIQKWESDFNNAMQKEFGIPGQKPFYVDEKLDPSPKQETAVTDWHREQVAGGYIRESSDSTESAVSALRSRLEDPEAFARQTDAWANQTRLPRE